MPVRQLVRLGSRGYAYDLGFGNIYSYVGGNPVNLVDPLGLNPGYHGDDGTCGFLCWFNGIYNPQPITQPGEGAGTGTDAETASKDCCPTYKNVYDANDGKHGNEPRPGLRGTISRLPSNGQVVLDNSFPAGNEDRRLGYDYSTGEIVRFFRHRTDPNKCFKYWHGFVVTQADLEPL